MSTPLDPFLVTCQLHPASHSTHGVNLAEIRACDKNRNVELGEIHTLIVPISISLRASAIHFCKVLNAMLTFDNKSSDKIEVAHSEPASSAELLAEDISGSLPRRNCL